MAVGAMSASDAQASGAAVKAEYDVFLSFAGPNRRTGRALAKALRASGLRVFFDEDDILLFGSITRALEVALGSSKALVAYYSVEYATRPACQLELMAAFLAGQREGDPLRRTVVINPEGSSTHIVPVELADARYAIQSSKARNVKALALEILRRTSELDGIIGEMSLRTHPRWFGNRPAGVRGFYGRFRELWALHSALYSTNFPVYLDPEAAWTVALCGLPGAGKTALVAAYAWQFGAAYPGGVYWLSLAGVEGAEVLRRYRREVRRIASAIGIASSRNAVAAIADRLANDRRPSLWIVDDLPPGFDPSVLNRILLQAGSGVRTILISDEDVFDGALPVVKVGPLSASDARAVLSRWRPPGNPVERAACDRLVRRLGYHAGAVDEAGRRLQHRQGIVSYDEVDVPPRSENESLPRTAATLRGLSEQLTADERLVLNISVICQSPVLPANLLKNIGDQRDADMGAALVRLQRRAIAMRSDTIWRLHQLVFSLHVSDDRIMHSSLSKSVITAVVELGANRRMARKERDALKLIAHKLAALDWLAETVKQKLIEVGRSASLEGNVEDGQDASDAQEISLWDAQKVWASGCPASV